MHERLVVAVLVGRAELQVAVEAQPLATTVEADVLNTDLTDPVTGELYAQRFVRFRFMLTT